MSFSQVGEYYDEDEMDQLKPVIKFAFKNLGN